MLKTAALSKLERGEISDSEVEKGELGGLYLKSKRGMYSRLVQMIAF